jgi:hypothetical protein
MPYHRQYSGYLDYQPQGGGSLLARRFIVRDDSIGFELTEQVVRGEVGWTITGRAERIGGKYIAKGVFFTNSGAKSADRTLRFEILEEIEGELLLVRGSVDGADIEAGEFEGELEAFAVR